MKKLFVSMLALSFLVAGAGAVFADQAMPSTTPVAKSVKHVKHHKKAKASKKSGKKIGAGATPVAGK